jgi:A/G-specific adenine glycosylase
MVPVPINPTLKRRGDAMWSSFTRQTRGIIGERNVIDNRGAYNSCMFTDAAKQALLDWYLAGHRALPWRQTRDPYRILVSEIMLQQTQADRVVPKYHAFLAEFPTLQALADAPASAVIRAWAGLGYNRRALNLQRACRAVVERFGSEMPRTVEELRSLPGVGPYTAGAIACFAFEQDVGFVDTNIRRVVHRVEAGPELPGPRLSTRDIEQRAMRLVPPDAGYVWNQALIELGATICQARSVACERCPVAAWCEARPTIRRALAEGIPSRTRPAERFETSSRYFRGRIVALLREAPAGLDAQRLARDIKPDEASAVWIEPYIDGLVRDGLIVTDGVGLRETAPAYDSTYVEEAVYRLPE